MDKRQLILIVSVIFTFLAIGLIVGISGFSRTSSILIFVAVAIPLLYWFLSRGGRSQ